MTRYDSLRVLLVLEAHRNLEIAQFDVKIAFLYGELKETVFVEVPEELEGPGISDTTICKINKSLYGLKQAPRCWNKKFHIFLTNYNFKESKADKYIYRAVVNIIIVV